MFGQIPATGADLRFQLLGIPVRVHPVFWLSSAFLAWDRGAQEPDLRKVFLRILCIFLAILVHELGHALVTRRYGWDSEIVLYFFGGYATSTRHTTWKDIAVSAAGPGAGFLLFLTFQFTAEPLLHWATGVLSKQMWFLLADAIYFSLFINFAWNVMNLIPVLPLDGGQISRELFLWFNPRRGMEWSLLLSVVAAGGIALLAMRAKMIGSSLLGLDPTFLALMFAYLAYRSYQQYEAAKRGYW